MKIYAQLNSPAYTLDLTENATIPDGYVEMKKERPEGEWHAKEDGKWHAGDPEKESLFIDIEMQVIAEQLLMHEDKDDSAVATENDWREYRKQLRKWSWDNSKFPNPKYRPVRPQ